MRVGLLGNMNNILFSITRFLRDRGVDATLLLFDDESAHFHPSADSFDLGFQAYTRALGWGTPLDIALRSPADIARSVREFDVLVGCGSAPAYLDKADRRLDVFVPYGGDLFELPFQLPGFRRRAPRSTIEMPLRQRRGLLRADAMLYDRSPAYERAVERLGYPGRRVLATLPLVYSPQYAPETIAAHYGQSHWHGEVARLRSRVDVLVLHHARHIWGSEHGVWQAKGNDKLVRGFAEARRRRPDVRFGLVMVEYGPEVNRTRALVSELGLERDVLWLPLTVRKELMIAMSLADVGCSELTNSWLSGGTIFEALAMGKPLLGRREDALYRGFAPELYPMMNASSDDEVAAHLVDYADRPRYWREVGSAGRAWYERFAVEESLRLIEDALRLPRKASSVVAAV